MSMRRKNEVSDDASVVIENNVVGIAQGFNDPFMKTKGEALKPLVATASVPDGQGRRKGYPVPLASTVANTPKRARRKSTVLESVPEGFVKSRKGKSVPTSIPIQKYVSVKKNGTNTKRRVRIAKYFRDLEEVGKMIQKSHGEKTHMESLVRITRTFKQGQGKEDFNSKRKAVMDLITDEVKKDLANRQMSANDFVSKHGNLVEAYNNAVHLVNEEQTAWNKWASNDNNWEQVGNMLEEKHEDKASRPNKKKYNIDEHPYRRPSWWIWDGENFRPKNKNELRDKRTATKGA